MQGLKRLCIASTWRGELAQVFAAWNRTGGPKPDAEWNGWIPLSQLAFASARSVASNLATLPPVAGGKPPPYTVRTYDAPKVRFSATVGREPEVELLLA